MAIDTFGPFRERMNPIWEQARVLIGGTQEMRDAGTDYLPCFEQETSKNYERRKSLATLTNFYVKARNNMVGEIFHDGIVHADSTLPEELTSNIDLRGTDLLGFAENIADCLLSKGLGGVLVDHPINERQLNLAEEQELGIRHYWTFIRPEAVIDYIVTYHNGAETLTHVRWFEDHIVPKPGDFEFGVETRIVVLDREIETDEETGVTTIGPPRGRIYRSGVEDRGFREKQEHETNNIHALGGSYEPAGDWRELRGFDEIPFIPFRINREGPWQSRPPLADIAEKNIQHWRHSSNYGNALEIGAFPILVRYGVNRVTPLSPDQADLPKNQSGESIVGPHIIMDLPSHQEAKAEYLEPTGAAYEALERALDRIIREAELMAIDLLTKQSTKTATEANYDRLQELSPLQRVAMEIERGLNRALEITASARGRNEKPGTVEINKDFGINTSDAIRVQALRDARAIGDITAETYLRELQSIGALSANLDPALEASEAKANDDDITDNVGRPDAQEAA